MVNVMGRILKRPTETKVTQKLIVLWHLKQQLGESYCVHNSEVKFANATEVCLEYVNDA